MPLPESMVRMRSGLASLIAMPIRWLAPIHRRLARFSYEIWARSQVHGTIEPGAQFIGWITVEGTGRVHIGRGTRLGRRAFLETQGSGEIRIGRNCTINDHTTIVSHESVTLGDYALVGEYASIRDANHGTEPGSPMRFQPHDTAPVSIGNDAWIGRGACVLKGVTVGDGAIVGANAVVTKDVEAAAISVGVPARAIGQRGSAS